MGGAEEFDESGDDTTINNFFDRRVSFFRQDLAEFSRADELLVGVIRKHSGDHLWKLVHDLSFSLRTDARTF
jgi:hypothetical protein